ncbi:zinc ABC transporter substrate-binding protein [Cnuibacter physcomitrellae]|uniref:metal ABC transporter solute-binding protein, Zn/Mn family n=1 Tax=Cnuibacter physcomitrellae TaxID=1619308 RepID=UPI002176066B|nr:zinc ABC transporter substrate-binding protein [Cnuibacter physcomitrellae]MCS5498617.1 zinc ABC transporter substrate-binding protein [Cnuibacter physcomitrellae]
MKSRPVLVATGALAAIALLSACSSTPSSTSPSASAGAGALSVVASTNVYGSIAQAIGGEDVQVTSIIDDPAQDPHEYEATARDQLALSEATVVIENGGGYDPFVDSMLSSAGNTGAVVLNAAEISGLMPTEGADAGDDASHTDDPSHTEDADHTHGADDGDGHDHVEGFNEHVWYSFPAMDALAKQLAQALSDADPADAATFQANYETFSGQLATLTTSVEDIKAKHSGEGVAITEPVPLYLLEAAGLVNKTPEEFSEAIEEGTDVPPLVLQETIQLMTDKAVAMLAYNEQTVGGETQQVADAATVAGIPVVGFTETLPDGDDYVSWMTANVKAVADALR